MNPFSLLIGIVIIGITFVTGIFILLQISLSIDGQFQNISPFFSILFIAALAVIVLGIAIGVSKGVFDEEITTDENKSKPKKSHKQTYLEFVKERIEAEKLIHNN